MSENDETTTGIGNDPTATDQSVTDIDTPVNEREDGETRPSPNPDDASCPVIHGQHTSWSGPHYRWVANQRALNVTCKSFNAFQH